MITLPAIQRMIHLPQAECCLTACESPELLCFLMHLILAAVELFSSCDGLSLLLCWSIFRIFYMNRHICEIIEDRYKQPPASRGLSLHQISLQQILKHLRKRMFIQYNYIM